MKTKLEVLELYMVVEDDYSFETRVKCNKEFLEASGMDINKISGLLNPLVDYIEENV